MIGIDLEWRPDARGYQNRVALLQLASSSVVLLIRTSHVGLLQSVVDFFYEYLSARFPKKACVGLIRVLLNSGLITCAEPIMKELLQSASAGTVRTRGKLSRAGGWVARIYSPDSLTSGSRPRSWATLNAAWLP